jgi:hypothetical protein
MSVNRDGPRTRAHAAVGHLDNATFDSDTNVGITAFKRGSCARFGALLCFVVTPRLIRNSARNCCRADFDR